MSVRILQIDTATDTCSVSISVDGVLLDCLEAQEPNLHASKLTVFIDELLKRNALAFTDLQAVAVSKGPGSYTGLRIGVSTAKGLCYALDLPLIAVNTLESMYKGYIEKHGFNENWIYVPMLDARRMEVYLNMYQNHQLIRTTEAVIVDAHTFDSYTSYKVVLFGSGAAKLMELFAHNPQIIVDESYSHSSAYMTASVYEKFTRKEFEDLIYFEPYYLKEFIATTPKAR